MPKTQASADDQAPEVEQGEQAAAPEAEKKSAKAKAVKKVRITIHSGKDDDDKGDVFLTHNFKQLQIKRDEEVEIPAIYLEVLKNAAIDTRSVDNEGNKTGSIIPRYAYTVEGE